ncbi:MAG: hypothetical protein OEU83_10860, partial [Gammaproteobacteria bacterium]|nr:hypothetical protein [Gammaproteobacteria bacterium]
PEAEAAEAEAVEAVSPVVAAAQGSRKFAKQHRRMFPRRNRQGQQPQQVPSPAAAPLSKSLLVPLRIP